MEIIACSAPHGIHDGALERAPLSCLLPEETHAIWDAFWGADDRYYACLTSGDGAERWYRIGDDDASAASAASAEGAEVAGRILPAAALLAGRDADGARAGEAGAARGARVVFRIRAGAGRGATSLAIRVGRSRRPRS